MNSSKPLHVVFILLCLISFGLFITFNSINAVLISNGYYPVPSYLLILLCYLIVYSIFALKNQSSASKTYYGLKIVSIYGLIGFIILSRIHNAYSYFPDNELITPLTYLAFIIVLIIMSAILWWLIRTQTQPSDGALFKDTVIVTLFIIILGYAVPISFYYDEIHIREINMKCVEKIIDDASVKNSAICNNISVIYFRYDDLIRKYSYKGNSHPYLHKKTALNLCRVASASVRKDNYQYCLNDKLKEHIKQKADTNYNSAKIYELRNDEMLRDAIICLNVYRKHHPEQSDNALEYAREVLVDSGWSISELDFQTECHDKYLNPSIVCDYLTVDKHDNR